jgi:hypothetical protein
VKKLLAFAVCVIVAVIAGCQINSAPDAVSSTNLTYFRDARTDVCFAATNSQTNGYYSTSITYVPCTPKVLEQVQK